MYCNKCKTINSDDSIFCKHCGNSLINSYIENEKKENKSVINNKKVINKKVNKVKKINKTTKHKDRKRNKDVKVVKKMTAFQKIMFALLIIIIIALLGVIAIFCLFGVKEYTKEVPYVVGMEYHAAKNKLELLDFSVSKKEVEGEEGIVLKQNKKDGTRVLNGTNIILYVGTNVETLPNLVGLSKEAAINILKKYNIKYEIEIVESDEEKVISQNYKKNTKIKDIDILKLKVGKVEKKKEEDKEKIEEEAEIEEEEDNI